MTNAIKVIQVNCNRSRHAHAMIEEIADRRGASLLLLSEPNRALTVNRPDWITDTRRSSCIVTTKQVNITKCGTGEGYAWIEIVGVGRIYSCYLSPNCALEDVNAFLDDLSASIREASTPNNVVVAGDFNAASEVWGASKTDKRGYLLLDWIAVNNLVVLNEGDQPTFHRAGQESHVDLTLCSEQTADTISSWSVLSHEENLSDHYCLEFTLETKHDTNKIPPRRRFRIRGTGILKETIRTHINKEGFPAGPTELEEMMLQTCSLASAPVSHPRRKKEVEPKYWWNPDISEARKACIAARRAIKRAVRKGSAEKIQGALRHYRLCRKALRIKIVDSKTKCWQDFIAELDNDPWGKPYKLIRGKLKKAPKVVLADHEKQTVLRKLFPQHDSFARTPYQGQLDYTPIVTREEVINIAAKIHSAKAPGPDGIPPAAVKILFADFPDVVAAVATKVLKEGIIPTDWKAAEVVLIPKGNGGFRPICLISSLAKGFEALIEERLRNFAEEREILSPRQYGFRKKKSALTAVQSVIDKAERLHSSTIGTRKLFLAIMLDVKNAFNSLPWKFILDSLARKGVPSYLLRLVSNYLQDRTITCGGITLPMTAGVPQGSILGPLLWNLAYDDVLRLSNLPKGVELIAYADDLAITVEATTELEAELNANKTLEAVSTWMTSAGLALAPHKSESIALTGRKKIGPIKLILNECQILLADSVRYLGVQLDKGLRGTHHLRTATAKAAKVAGTLAKILPNIHGPGRTTRRRLIMSVAESIALYGSPVWFTKSTETKGNRKLLRKTQRISALRIIQAYRTVSTSAALVLAETIPWDLKVEESRRLWSQGGRGSKPKEREITLDAWQAEWSAIPEGDPGAHVRDIIPNIRAWLQRPGGDIDHFLTQIITGHGNFQTYLHKIGKAPSNLCLHCEQDVPDDPAHTLLICPKWEDARSSAISGAVDSSSSDRSNHSDEPPITLPRDGIKEFVAFITSSVGAWKLGAAVAGAVLRAKSDLNRPKRSHMAGAIDDANLSPGSQVLGQSASFVVGNPGATPAN